MFKLSHNCIDLIPSQRRQWQPTPILLPGKSHGWRSLVGCSPWVAKSRTRLSDFTFTFPFMHWRRQWQPTPGFLPGESQGWGSLVGCRLWGHTELDTTEVTQQLHNFYLSFKVPVKGLLLCRVHYDTLRRTQVMLSLCFYRSSHPPSPLASVTSPSKPPRGCFPTPERAKLLTSVNVFLLQDP